MRWLACVVPLILLASSACDEKKDAGGPGATASASATTTAEAPTVEAGAGDLVGVEAGAKPAASFTMPERPVPHPQTMVGSGMPIDVQQRAIAYMVAMRAPRIDDPAADPEYAAELATKLKPIVLSMDSGADKARMNRVEIVANGRQIDLLMASGCDAKTPMRAVVTRAALPLSTLVQHGVLVVRCNDSRVQCLQSTRDPDDVLCTTAPRRK